MTVQGSLSIITDIQHTNPLDLVTGSANLLKTYRTALLNGTGAGQADKVWSDQRTLGASSNEDLDLNGATLTDPFGVALAFVKVKGLIVSAAAANPANITVGNAASNGFISMFGAATHTLILRPGATFALIAGQADATGYAVTAATADLLRIASGAGGNHVYDIQIIGTSA